MKSKSTKPFLRWAGGKQSLLKYLKKFVPHDFGKGTYFEPFLGAGSLFLTLRPEEAVLSDLNKHLIECYEIVRDNPTSLYYSLLEHKKNTSYDFYYETRKRFNESLDKKSIVQASRFIYLNRTCFNGIYRVNSLGYFNVPYDPKKKVIIPTLSELKEFSNILKKAQLFCFSYEQILSKVKDGDFVYLDPPYPPLNGTSYFAHYTKDRFPLSDQKKVAILAKELSQKGCKVLVSNADILDVRKLYTNWFQYPVEVTRHISCKSLRNKVRELIITNYKI